MTQSNAESNSQKTGKANRMWGGHFSGGPDEVMEIINASIDFDIKLYRQDIAGSRAHVRMLAAQGIVSDADAEAILGGLDSIEQEIENGHFATHASFEDIHMHIEARLTDLIGEAAGRLHTARSRNDQVATDFKLYVRDALDGMDADLKELQEALLDRAEEHAETLMPGFTHLQTAQPVTLGHHLMAYVEMLTRDRSRVSDARRRMNQCPLGAAALAGTSFDIDRAATAKALGFDGPTRNSLDSVSDRDFALDYLSLAAILAMHLSRFAEELVIWSSAQFKFITMSDAFTTGSSIMPQKRNPDAAELVRGKTGRINGALISLLTTMKALPLTYSKDMQEDKEPVFDVAENLPLCVKVMTGMVRDMTVHADAMKEAAGHGYSTATDLADWLVRHLNIPFRSAHHITGKAVQMAEAQGCALHKLPLESLQQAEPRITQDIFSVLSVEQSVASRMSFGGTAPERVKDAITEARKRVKDAA